MVEFQTPTEKFTLDSFSVEDVVYASFKLQRRNLHAKFKFAVCELASLLRADKPTTRHRQTLTYIQSHPACRTAVPAIAAPINLPHCRADNRNTILNLLLRRAVSLLNLPSVAKGALDNTTSVFLSRS